MYALQFKSMLCGRLESHGAVNLGPNDDLKTSGNARRIKVDHQKILSSEIFQIDVLSRKGVAKIS